MPHRSGDEPAATAAGNRVWFVCPTGVGMNRKWTGMNSAGCLRMPHRSGDEPYTNQTKHRMVLYAPQEWG